MRHRTRILLAATITASLVAASLPQAASAAFDSTELKCRSAIAKSGGKYTKTVLKALTGCHKERDKNGPNGLDCNDLSTADLKDKVPTAATKFGSSVASKCTTGSPNDILYNDCPAPCAGAITSYSDVSTCLVCLTNSNNEAFSETANGDPTAPIADDAEADCHKAITKNGSKLFNSVIKTVTKCQANFEKNGSETVSPSCVDGMGFIALTDDAFDKAQEAVADKCAEVTLPSATLDPCGGEATVFDLSVCVATTARNAAQELVKQILQLGEGGATTTTTSTTTTLDTTTTTIPGGTGACPDLGELILYSKMSNEVCATNGDCTAPRFCNTSTLRCETVADLDSGWTGAGHDSDINDGVVAMAFLDCPGPASPGCGQCNVTGLSPEPGNCRCANDIRAICDHPFAAGPDCTGGAVCNCFFGTPFPLTADGTPVCVANRFSQDITGTANPDLGSGVITANLRAQVYNGITTDMPCPVCGGKCSNDATGCIFDADCDGGATCVQDVPNDGIRNGLCVRNPNTHVGDGTTCDVTSTNASFPARLNDATPGQGGAGYSIDCQPLVGANISGQGLKISLTQSTGVLSLTAGLDCDAGGVGTDLCPCMVCSGDQTAPCDSNGDCEELPGNCSLATSGGGFACSANGDCLGANLGPCNSLSKCAKRNTFTCANNAACIMDAGTCELQSCTANGTGDNPQPNKCTDDVCTDQGGGEGSCLANPAKKFCDQLVRADGSGINACASNTDCLAGYGTCTLTSDTECFLDPIVATGAADPQFPVAGAVFCVPPTSNTALNSVAGLPGPGRVTSQGAARTFCATDHNVEYNPGGIPACPP